MVVGGSKNESPNQASGSGFTLANVFGHGEPELIYGVQKDEGMNLSRSSVMVLCGACNQSKLLHLRREPESGGRR